METTATYVKNNFGVIMKAVEFEDIVVRKNGRAVAKIVRFEEPEAKSIVREHAANYGDVDREISYDEFVTLTGQSENRYELIFGKIYLLASPRVSHQNMVLGIATEFQNFFKGKVCHPFVSPFDITLRVDHKKNVVQPDLGVICDMDENVNESGYYMGVPSLVVEVLSGTTRTKDMVKKLNLYMLTGIQEYWIVDIEGMSVYVYTFEKQAIKGIKNYRFGEVVLSESFENLQVEF